MEQRMFYVVVVENGEKRTEGIAVEFPFSWKATEVARKAYPEAEFVGALITNWDAEEHFMNEVGLGRNQRARFPADLCNWRPDEPFRGCYDTVVVENRHNGSYIKSYKAVLNEHRTEILRWERC